MGRIDIGFGFSKNTNAEEAVREASIKLRSSLSSPKIELCIVLFNLPLSEAKKLSFNIKRTLNPHTIVGYSLPFLIVEEAVFKKGIIIIGLSGIEVRAGIFLKEEDTLEVVEKFIWRILRETKGKRREFFLSFSEFGSSLPSNFLKGLERGLGKNFPFLGIFSCKDYTLFPSLFLYNENFSSRGAIGLLFFGNLDIFFEANSGFSPLGKGGEITSFDKNIINKIDNKPAVDFYRDYFGEKVIRSQDYFKNVVARYPLGFKIKGFSGYIISSPLKVNSDGSLSLLKDVLSTQIKLTIPIRDSLINSSEETAKICKTKANNPKIAIFFESHHRYKFLGSFFNSQLKTLKSILGNIPLVGGVSFYSMGLLSPLKIDLGHFIFENSFSFIVLGEK